MQSVAIEPISRVTRDGESSRWLVTIGSYTEMHATYRQAASRARYLAEEMWADLRQQEGERAAEEAWLRAAEATTDEDLAFEAWENSRGIYY